MRTQCLALAKVVQNERLKTLRIMFTFDTAARKVTANNAVYITGDLCRIGDERWPTILAREVERAKELLRTDRIEFFVD